MKIILRVINKYKLNFFSLIIILFLSHKSISAKENRIIFKINDIAFTSLDLEKRLEYLDFVGSNNNIDKKIIIEDFISANLFFEYYKNLDVKNNYKEKIFEIYENILDQNNQNNKTYEYTINKTDLLGNIKIDYIRKIVLENILNSTRNNLVSSQEEIDLLYKIKLDYINVKVNDFSKIKNEITNLNNINIEKIKNYLNLNNIEYFSKQKEINNINSVDKRLKENILTNNNFFIIENKNVVSFIFIEKKFETFEGIVVNLYSVSSENELNNEFLNCSNLSQVNKNKKIINKEYKMVDLNNELKKTLVDINDYVEFNSNNEKVYIVLCDIKFDKKMLNNVNFNKLINLNINEIENNFIIKYSKIYNLIKFDE